MADRSATLPAATTRPTVAAFRTFAVAFSHSAVNSTTLGYGDIVMSPRWRLLGPQEAGCGTLAFGWSIAAIVRRHTERSTEGRFATLGEKFANWIVVSNGNASLGLALALLYVVGRGLH